MAPQRGPRAELIAQGVAGASLFAFFTALVMRTAHHWVGVPFQLEALLASMWVQAGLSLVWTLIALGLMIGGHLRHRREVWLIGAALIAVVVAKLFFVELSNRGGLARIVSFIGVGGLLLVVGYFAPLPPKRVEPVLETEGASS
ncbi:putative membrane protein [Pseudomonas sp. 22 E 5]|nr:putative membrane protein [Pseudomonas sp. 22 E 5]